MDSRESLRYAGDLDLQILEISSLVTDKKVNIYDMFVEMNIYEDLFSNSISGTIVINDSMDLIANIPMVGEEVLHMVYKTPSMEDDIALVDKKFFIYKIADRVLNSDKTYIYIMHFISEEGFTDMFIKMGRAYSGQLSEIVKKIFSSEDALGSSANIRIEPTSNSFKFVAPNWSPMKCLNWITPRSISLESKAPNYIFYEDMFKFNFVSISSLISADSYLKYFFNDIDPSAMGDDAQVSTQPDLNPFLAVREFVNDIVFDIADRMFQGFYASKLMEFDILSKKVNIKTLNYIEYFGKTPHLEKFPVNSTNFLMNPESNVVYYPTQYYMHDEFGTDDPMSWVLERKCLMQQIGAYSVDITVPGRSDMHVGKTIDFIYNTVQAHDEATDAKDAMYSGKYLIQAINHRISRQEHTMVMKLCKDSIATDLG